MTVHFDTHQNAKRKQGRDTVALSIFGLGYVGAVSSACFANLGHKVIGVDPDSNKVATINAGQSPIVEAGLGDLLSDGVRKQKLSATQDPTHAILNTDISFVCVGTPSTPEGDCDLTYLKAVSQQIGEALRQKDDFHIIVYRSTVPPGTTEKELAPIIEEASGKKAGEGFGIGFHPEFLRESTAIADFHEPPKTVVGAHDDRTGQAIADLYKGIDEDVLHTEIKVAEMVKYTDNTWHALKVSFANEIGKLGHALGVDSHAVMNVFVKDTKLNISPYYMKPGFAFGGSCLPKDVRGINHLAEDHGVSMPVIGAIIESNTAQIQHAANMIAGAGKKKVGFLGLTFKADTDDLRESPVLELISVLHADGYEIKVYDPHLDLDAALRHHAQHSRHNSDGTESLMSALPDMVCSSVEEVLERSSTIVVSHNTPMFQQTALLRRQDQMVIDLVRVFEGKDSHKDIFAAGMQDFLQKPAQAYELIEAVRKWVPAKTQPRVLLAEDDTVVGNITRAKLTKAGFVVDWAKDGGEAITFASASGYDLIFMDLSMPNVGGLEASRNIRKGAGHNTQTPIVALTALAAPEQSRTYRGICW